MALKKIVPQPTGVSCEYWRLNGIDYRYEIGGMCHMVVRFELYVSEATRRSGCRPIEFKSVRVEVTTIPVSAIDFSNETKMGYDIAKCSPDFQGAENC